MTKHRVFISHYGGDHDEVNDFIDEFGNTEGIFMPRVLGANENYDLIDSTKTDYVMRQIRVKYLEDTTVTIVLIGSCTHSRRYVDWEIKSSLTQGSSTPNGLIGILLPSQGDSGNLPPRLRANWCKGHRNCYARYYVYPDTPSQLGDWIEDAFDARTSRAHLINNSKDMMKYNAKCEICKETH